MIVGDCVDPGRGAGRERGRGARAGLDELARRGVSRLRVIGPQTVNTMPRETIEAFQAHGEVRLSLEEGLAEARELFDELAKAGVEYDDVTRVLEEEGVQKFADSFDELIEGISSKKDELVAA